MSQPDTKKGAIPLDQRSEPGKPSAASADGASQPTDMWANLVEQMGLTLGYLYNEVKAGRVKALSCVFVDDSGVPQYAHIVAPNSSVPLLAGMMVATDQVKGGAEKSMHGYRDWLRQQAEEQAKSHEQPTSAASAESASKPN